MKFDNIKKPFVLILIGPPLSGKTTWIKENFYDDDISVISRDEIIMDIAKSIDYNWAYKNVSPREVSIELDLRLRKASENKHNTIVDMTNMKSRRRRHTLSYFRNDFTKIAIIFPILEWEEYRNRNHIRNKEENKNIPEHVIKNMISSYQPINDTEGFDKVISL